MYVSAKLCFSSFFQSCLFVCLSLLVCIGDYLWMPPCMRLCLSIFLSLSFCEHNLSLLCVCMYVCLLQFVYLSSSHCHCVLFVSICVLFVNIICLSFTTSFSLFFLLVSCLTLNFPFTFVCLCLVRLSVVFYVGIYHCLITLYLFFCLSVCLTHTT